MTDKVMNVLLAGFGTMEQRSIIIVTALRVGQRWIWRMMNNDRQKDFRRDLWISINLV